MQKIFTIVKNLYSGKIARSRNSQVSYIGMILATINVSLTVARRDTNSATKIDNAGFLLPHNIGMKKPGRYNTGKIANSPTLYLFRHLSINVMREVIICFVIYFPVA